MNTDDALAMNRTESEEDTVEGNPFHLGLELERQSARITNSDDTSQSFSRSDLRNNVDARMNSFQHSSYDNNTTTELQKLEQVQEETNDMGENVLTYSHQPSLVENRENDNLNHNYDEMSSYNFNKENNPTAADSLKSSEAGEKIDSNSQNENEAKKDDEDDASVDSFILNDPQVQRDAADHLVAFFVHVAMFFFFILFGATIFGIVITIKSFGMIGLVSVLTLLGIFTVIGFAVYKIINEEPRYKPMKQRLTRWKAIARVVINQELEAMHADLREHYLLTNGPAGDEYTNMDDNANSTNGTTPHSAQQKNKKRRRSILLKVITAPFGGLKKMQGKSSKFGFSRKKKSKSKKTKESSPYVPPVV